MAGYQTIQALRPILHRGPVATPVVDRALVARSDKSDRTALRPGEHRHWRSKSRFVKVGTHYVLAPDIVQEIRDLRAAGKSFGFIAEKLQINKATARRYASNVPMPSGQKLSAWDGGLRMKPERNLAFAERLRRAGFSYREIGENLNCSQTAARALLKNLPPDSSVKTPTRRLVPRVSAVTGISCKQLRRGQFDSGKKNSTDRNKARHILFWLMREHFAFSFPVIGASLGGFHHTSVINGYNRVQVVASRLGVTTEMYPTTAARKLWLADWREVGK